MNEFFVSEDAPFSCEDAPVSKGEFVGSLVSLLGCDREIMSSFAACFGGERCR